MSVGVAVGRTHAHISQRYIAYWVETGFILRAYGSEGICLITTPMMLTWMQKNIKKDAYSQLILYCIKSSFFQYV